MEPAFNALQSVNPVFALAAGLVLGAVATLALTHWKPRATRRSDPLSNLFEGDTLQSQIARVTDDAARSERADRDASALRAKIFARQAARAAKAPGNAPPVPPVPPHRADRYEHQAVLDHIAKVMRAGTELDKEPEGLRKAKDDEQWEEVLLLPAPAPSTSSQKAA